MTTRNVEPADIERCAAVFASVFSAPPWSENWTPENSFQRLADCAATPGFIGLLVEDAHGVAAFAFGYLQRYMDEKHYNLLEFCVAPRAQRKGVGGALLRELEARLRAAGANRLCTLTARGTPAQSFYEKAGLYVSPKMILMARRFTS